MVTAEDVAAMCVFLCSPAAHNITGQAISVDGNVEVPRAAAADRREPGLGTGGSFRKLMPPLIFGYILNFLDRTNIGMAKAAMEIDVGISAAATAWGRACSSSPIRCDEVPSNLILQKVGARFWITRIMFSWGVVSSAMALVKGETSFVRPARPARHRRGGAVPRHHPLPDLLVRRPRTGRGPSAISCSASAWPM